MKNKLGLIARLGIVTAVLGTSAGCKGVPLPILPIPKVTSNNIRNNDNYLSQESLAKESLEYATARKVKD